MPWTCPPGLPALCAVGVGQGPEVRLSGALVASFSSEWATEAERAPGFVGSGVVGRTSPSLNRRFRVLRVLFTQQILIEHVLCFRPDFRSWDVAVTSLN